MIITTNVSPKGPITAIDDTFPSRYLHEWQKKRKVHVRKRCQTPFGVIHFFCVLWLIWLITGVTRLFSLIVIMNANFTVWVFFNAKLFRINMIVLCLVAHISEICSSGSFTCGLAPLDYWVERHCLIGGFIQLWLPCAEKQAMNLHYLTATQLTVMMIVNNQKKWKIWRSLWC